MKNVAFSAGRQSETVSQEELISAMVENYEYTQDQVMNLLHDRPRAAVRDTLHALVERGIVWRNASQARVKYALLEGEQLREAVERKTTRGETPAWMKATLTGYEAQNARHRELCMTVRK
jgi:hypothetical protein